VWQFLIPAKLTCTLIITLEKLKSSKHFTHPELNKRWESRPFWFTFLTANDVRKLRQASWVTSRIESSNHARIHTLYSFMLGGNLMSWPDSDFSQKLHGTRPKDVTVTVLSPLPSSTHAATSYSQGPCLLCQRRRVQIMSDDHECKHLTPNQIKDSRPN